MLMFFFLLMMLALAWGITDQLHDIQSKVPPAPPAPVRAETSVPVPAPPIPPAGIAPTGSEPADGSKPADAVMPDNASQAAASAEVAVKP